MMNQVGIRTPDETTPHAERPEGVVLTGIDIPFRDIFILVFKVTVALLLIQGTILLVGLLVTGLLNAGR